MTSADGAHRSTIAEQFLREQRYSLRVANSILRRRARADYWSFLAVRDGFGFTCRARAAQCER